METLGARARRSGGRGPGQSATWKDGARLRLQIVFTCKCLLPSRTGERLSPFASGERQHPLGTRGKGRRATPASLSRTGHRLQDRSPAPRMGGGRGVVWGELRLETAAGEEQRGCDPMPSPLRRTPKPCARLPGQAWSQLVAHNLVGEYP